ncbi:unnamed protein product [marine sediment metagenome]|uniref:Uncharacterized protein n=1 Tax=marine sediment metagenome TaxID=412755 RepID=X1N0E6_9ZZZZ
MAIEKLTEQKKWRLRQVPLGSVVCPSSLEIIVSFDMTKQARVTSVNLVAPGLQHFELVEMDVDAATEVILEPYFLAAAGMIIDARTFDDPIAWVAAGRRVAIRSPQDISCVASGLARAGMNVWELTG